jgi:hypothetical protein
MGIEDDITYIKTRLDVMEINMDNLQFSINKLLAKEQSQDRQDKEKRIKKCLDVSNGLTY